MYLNETSLTAERSSWEAAGYQLPRYDRAAMSKNTKENPFWLHFGAGNIFRAFQANVVEQLLNEGILDRGLIAVGGHEAMEKLFAPRDNYNLLATLKANGTVEKTVIGSIAESLTTDAGYDAHLDRLKEIFAKDSLQMVSFTITEKGYSLTAGDGSFTEQVGQDLVNGPDHAVSYMGKIAAFLYARFQAGAKPLAMVSMDNCSHNGDRLKAAVLTFAESWERNGLAEAGFSAYISDETKVAFPWSMIDKIVPRPDAAVEKMLAKDGVEGIEPIITERKTYIAPFVNAEETQYLVIEDKFPNGRPQLEKGGLIFTDGETVDKVEKMKVCTCLNPLHTALAVYGCLLGYEKISQEMNDPQLLAMTEGIGYKEGLPVVVDPGVLDPKQFIDTVITKRLPNPFMPDTPQRIATDTSQKLGVRFGETVKAYAASEERSVSELKLIPLVYAGWLRYLMAIDDNGNPFELSADPLLEDLTPIMAQFRLGEKADTEAILRPILENETIFGINLYKAGMAETVCRIFEELTAKAGAIRETLKRYV